MSGKKVARTQSEWFQQLMFEPDKDAPPEEYDLAQQEPVVKLTVISDLLRGGRGGGGGGGGGDAKGAGGRSGKYRMSDGCARFLTGIVDGAVRHIIQSALQLTKKRQKIITSQLLLQALNLTPFLPPPRHPYARPPAARKSFQKKDDAARPPDS